MFPSILIALAVAATEPPQLPDWMTGCWETERDGTWTQECWSEPRGTVMVGFSRTGTGGQMTAWEVMQFQLGAQTPDDRHVARLGFWAAPQGSAWTMFAWSPNRLPGITVVNVVNDYPQRVRYWREGDALMAEIAFADGSKARRWRYRKAKP